MTKTKVKSVAEVDRRARALLPKAKTNSNTPVCLVIDGMNMAYQAYYAYKRLSHKGKSVSIIYGLPSILKSLLQHYRPEKVVVCWDGEKNPERLKVLPTYKGHREEGRDPIQRKRFYKEIDRVRRLLKYMGIAQAHNPAMEGDDMIYWMTKKMSALYKVVIISGDKDMHQLINYDVSVYNQVKKIPYTPFAFLPDHGCEIHQFVDYLCLTGDDSDDIPGYGGIGPARANKFFMAFKSIKEYLDNPNAEFSGLTDKDRLKEVYERNRLLIDLKYFNEKFHKMKDVKWYKGRQAPTFNEERYNRFCIKWNLKTFQTETFKAPFKKLSE